MSETDDADRRYDRERANLSSIEGVGAGVLEYRIDWGGYRVYFGRDGDSVVILLGGGPKSRQQQDIATAHGRWTDYKKRADLGTC